MDNLNDILAVVGLCETETGTVHRVPSLHIAILIPLETVVSSANSATGVPRRAALNGIAVSDAVLTWAEVLFFSVFIFAITIETGFRGDVTSPVVKIAETAGFEFIAGAGGDEGLCDGGFGGEGGDKHEDGEDESEKEEDVVIHE